VKEVFWVGKALISMTRYVNCTELTQEMIMILVPHRPRTRGIYGKVTGTSNVVQYVGDQVKGVDCRTKQVDDNDSDYRNFVESMTVLESPTRFIQE
jgi:hypothetical protein